MSAIQDHVDCKGDNGTTAADIAPPLLLPNELFKLLLGDYMLFRDTSFLTYVHPSIEVTSQGVCHGRGLVNTSETVIPAGEVLFITPPAAEAPMEAVLRVYFSKGGSVGLQEIAETLLLKEMKRVVRKDPTTSASFLILQSRHSMEEYQEYWTMDTTDHKNLLSILLCKGDDKCVSQVLDYHKNIDNERLRGIIRKNAFGPDFHHYERIQVELSKSTKYAASYTRLLGMYPLAAMINHACMTNATRIFIPCSSNGSAIINLMVATATQDIKPGQEVLWSYIPPTMNPQNRNKALEHFGFTCQCIRCKVDNGYLKDLWDQTHSACFLNKYNNLEFINFLEDTVYPQIKPNKNQVDCGGCCNDGLSVDDATTLGEQSLRLAYTDDYINLFNFSLCPEAPCGMETKQREDEYKVCNFVHILDKATALHHTFSAIHNASTEHVSIVHLCYELSTLVARIMDSYEKDEDAVFCKDISRPSPSFWIEQLKHAHKCRYSNYLSTENTCNKGFFSTKALFQHTKLVLRASNGWHDAKQRFI
jgi:hypothetical protein